MEYFLGNLNECKQFVATVMGFKLETAASLRLVGIVVNSDVVRCPTLDEYIRCDVHDPVSYRVPKLLWKPMLIAADPNGVRRELSALRDHFEFAVDSISGIN